MKAIQSIILLCLFVCSVHIRAQVSISDYESPPDGSAALDVQSWNKGLLPPRIDFNDRPQPAAAGLLVYVTANGPLGNDALYFFDGANWQKILAEQNQGITIGDAIEGGIVFYYDQQELTGFVAAPMDQQISPWGCFGQLMGPNAQYTGIWFGSYDSYTIINNCNDPEAAAYLCDTLTLNGYTDWFLPSRDELLELYNQRNAVGGFENFLYWSSTEAADATPPEEHAWIVNFDYGSAGWANKLYYLNVRCIRQFYN